MPDNIISSHELPLGRNFARLTRYYFGALTKRLEHLDVERHFSVLLLIGRTGDRCTQQFVSDYLQKDKASMVRITDYLVKKGYVTRVPNPDDRREYHLRLTAKARKDLPRIQKGIKNLNELATKGMSSKQKTDFYSSLDKISKNLGSEPAHKVIMNFKKAKSSGK